MAARSFWLLAPYVAAEAVRDLVTREPAETSLVGIGLTIRRLVLMPALGIAKQRLGRRLSSGATAGEGTQNLLCAYLAAAVLAGLVGNALLGWWWLDPIAALAVAAIAVKEGRDAWRGDNCCAVPGLETDSCECGPNCTDACCAGNDQATAPAGEARGRASEPNGSNFAATPPEVPASDGD